MTKEVEKVTKINLKSYPNHMHFCRPRRKHVLSFEKTGLKLYEVAITKYPLSIHLRSVN